MVKRRKFWVKIPNFLENPRQPDNPNKSMPKITVSARIVMDESGKLIFDAVDPSIGNTKMVTKAIYATFAAVALTLRKMKVFPSSSKGEAEIRFQNYNHLEADIEEIKAAINKLFVPGSPEWYLIENATVREEEPLIELEEEEKEALLKTARQIMQTKVPVDITDGKYVYYFEGSEELNFAPNAYWAIWALNNARNNDENWIYAIPRDAQYDGKNSWARIAWIKRGSRADMRSNKNAFAKRSIDDLIRGF